MYLTFKLNCVRLFLVSERNKMKDKNEIKKEREAKRVASEKLLKRWPSEMFWFRMKRDQQKDWS